MKLKDQAVWDKGVAAQRGDGYGLACFAYAERWADLMEKRMAEGAKLRAMAKSTSHEADTDGITGFMYGMAVSILAECWEHGEELRKWHNKKYGAEGAKGTVNPAIFTLG